MTLMVLHTARSSFIVKSHEIFIYSPQVPVFVSSKQSEKSPSQYDFNANIFT
jgi:hypothetical protein